MGIKSKFSTLACRDEFEHVQFTPADEAIQSIIIHCIARCLPPSFENQSPFTFHPSISQYQDIMLLVLVLARRLLEVEDLVAGG